MYYPFSMLDWVRDRRRRAEERPVTTADVAVLRVLAESVLDRLDRDERSMLRRQAATLAAATVVPVLGHLTLAWPLTLVAVAAALDALAVFLADEIRTSKAYGAVRAALFHAAQVEIALKLAGGLGGSGGHARVKVWRADPSWHLQGAIALLAVPIGIVAMLLPDIVRAGDWLAVVAITLVPLATRAHEALRDVREAPQGRVPDPRYLPRAPAALILVTLAGGMGYIAWLVLEFAGVAPYWRGIVLLAIWIAYSLLMARRWLRSMERARSTLQAFLALDARIVRHRLKGASAPGRAGQGEFLDQAMAPDALWPPLWIELPAADDGAPGTSD